MIGDYAHKNTGYRKTIDSLCETQKIEQFKSNELNKNMRFYLKIQRKSRQICQE